MRRVRFLLGVGLAAILAGAPGVPAATFRMTCRDGESGDVLEGFGRVKRFGNCDADSTCDGVCTFTLWSHCMRCRLLNNLRSCPRAPGDELPCGILEPPPCPDHFTPYAAVAATPGKVNRKIVRAGRDRFILRCRAKTCSATTTTLPAPPDVTGMWSFVVTNLVNDCPATVTYQFYTQGAIGFLRTGTEVIACGDGIPYTRGEVRQASIIADTTLSGSGIAFHLSSVLPDVTGHAVADLRYDFTAVGPPVAGLPCSRTAVISIDPPPKIPCSEHDDCLWHNPCLRCVGGVCTRNQLCGRP